jgi:chromosomal replication initiation ATPase DnaA
MLRRKGDIEIIKDKYLAHQKENKNMPALKALVKKITIEDISREVDEKISDSRKLGRNIKIYLTRKHTEEMLDEIGGRFGIGGSGVCKIWRRITDQIEKDKELAKTVKKIEDILARFKT